MNTPAGTNRNERPDLERELIAAMSDFANATPAPTYHTDAFLPSVQRHHGRAMWALAAAVAAVAAVGGSLTLLPGHRSTVPVGTRPTHQQSAAPSPSPEPTNADAAFTRMHELDTLVSAAEMYENPATRSKVNLSQVAALFTDESSFKQAWGTGGLGVTCGSVVDGAINGALNGTVNGSLNSTNTDILLYSGTTRLNRELSPVWGAGDSIKLDGVTCSDTTSQPGDAVISKYFGLLASGSSGGDTLVKAGVQVPAECLNGTPLHAWYADWPSVPTASTLNWSVTLNGGVDWPASVSVTGSTEITATNCNAYGVG